MFEPNRPLQIMRDKRLTHQQRAFLLWCWLNKDTADRCNLISKRQDCRFRERSIGWYADLLGCHRSHFHAYVYKKLKELGLIKIEDIGTRNEITYVDFSKYI